MYMIVAPIPEDLATMVQPYRLKYDTMANYVAPHITVVTPFQFSDSVEDLIDHLKDVGETHAPIKISLVGWDIYQQQNLFQLRLPIIAGRVEFAALRNHLFSGPLSHLTASQKSYWPNIPMGEFKTEAEVDRAKQHLKRFEPQYIFRVTYLNLLHQLEPAQPWQTKKKFGLNATVSSSRGRSRTPSGPLKINEKLNNGAK